MLSSVFTSPTRARAAVLVGVVMVLFGVLLGASTASAHAELLSSFPANQELLRESPSEIALQFTEGVDPIEPGIRLLGPPLQVQVPMVPFA